MLACNCELPEEYCLRCSILRKRGDTKTQVMKRTFWQKVFNKKPKEILINPPLRMVNRKMLPYDEAKKYFTGDKDKYKKSLEICLRED